MDKKIKNRGWVKTAAIIFLAIMLVLTFFSNTIMNYSLSQVSAEYTKYGTINSKVNGTGQVEASDVYEVKTESTREIKSVAVRVGDTVEAGQTLFYLSGDDSTELEQAQNDYDTKNIEYMKVLITSENKNNYAPQLLEIEQLQKDLDDAKTKRDEADKKYKDFNNDLNSVSTNLSSGTFAQKVSEMNSLLTQLESTKDSYLTAKNNVTAIERRMDLAQLNLNQKNSAYKVLEKASKLIEISFNDATAKAKAISDKITKLESDIAKYSENIAENANPSEQTNELKSAYLQEVENVKLYENNIDELEKIMPDFEIKVTESQAMVWSNQPVLLEMETKKNNAQTVYDTALEVQKDAEDTYNTIKSDIPKSVETLTEEVKTAQRQLDAKNLELKYLVQDYNKKSSSYNLRQLYALYQEAKADKKAAQLSYSQALDNPEIDDATLRKLEDAYNTAIKNYSYAAERYESAVSDKNEDSSDYDRQVAAKELELRNAEEDMQALQKDLSDAKKAEVKLNAAKVVVDAKKAISNEAKVALSAVKTKYNELNVKFTSYQNTLDNTTKLLNSKKSELEKLKESLTKSKASVEIKRNEYLKALNNTGSESVAVEVLISELNSEMSSLSTLNVKAEKSKEDIDNRKAGIDAAKLEFDEATEVLNTEKSLLENENAYITNYDAKKTKYNELQTEITNQKNTLTDAVSTARNDCYAKERALSTAKTALETKKREDLSGGKIQNLELDKQRKDLEKLREKLDKLKTESIEGTVVSKYAGVISEINVIVGDKTDPTKSLAKIQIIEKGYTVSFAATTEQCKALKVGDIAEIRNIWSGGTEAVLESIKNDSANPGKSKILTFKVTGEVNPGQTLNLSVGSKSQNFDAVVPNTAIREDSNGKYVLTVVSKQSPLGNRYIATRVNVDILATDETSTAISGALYGNEFIITSSTKPIVAGEQVRLVDEAA